MVTYMAITVSLINMKGGVGKTTLTVNLAMAYAAYSDWLKKVLMVDLDPQFNATQYLLGLEHFKSILDNNEPTVWDIFEQRTKVPSGPVRRIEPSDAVHEGRNIEGGGRVDIIPSRLELAFSLKNPGGKEDLLHKLIEKLEDEYDLILIDCAPTESVLTTAAYVCSDYLLVPVRPEYLSSIGLPSLAQSMADFKEAYEDSNLELAGIVFNATDEYSPEEELAKNEVRQVARKNKWHVFPTEIPYSRSFAKGAREHEPIFWTSYAHSDRKRAIHFFAEELSERIGL